MTETEAWLLSNDQHDSEAGFLTHHSSVSFCGICQRNSFDHRADSLQSTEGKRVLRIDRSPVMVPAIDRMPKRSGTGFASMGSSPPTPATMSWLRGARRPDQS